MARLMQGYLQKGLYYHRRPVYCLAGAYVPCCIATQRCGTVDIFPSFLPLPALETKVQAQNGPRETSKRNPGSGWTIQAILQRGLSSVSKNPTTRSLPSRWEHEPLVYQYPRCTSPVPDWPTWIWLWIYSTKGRVIPMNAIPKTS